MDLRDLALTIGSTLRLTRLVTSDSITEWVTGPARRAIDQRDSRARAARYQALSDTFARYDAEDRLAEAARDYGVAELQRLVDEQDEPFTWTARLASGFDCPFCIGFWIGAGVIASHAAARRTGTLRAWRAVAGALTLNYLTGHTSARLD